MKSKQKQTPTEIIDNQRQAVVEKIIEDKPGPRAVSV